MLSVYGTSKTRADCICDKQSLLVETNLRVSTTERLLKIQFIVS